MQPKTPKLLEDIRAAAAFIRDSVRGKTLDDYHGDRLLRQAIERDIEIVVRPAPRSRREGKITVAVT